ncbi:sigma-70 family RNA polymerase sigma factor [Jeotgalibaca ciconiae]|uniref:FliA/WhiG family RNA polymerase sigma factor n=1 Tax=Jeotgalibaca ciconiae TaxID=2496265 RepID=A0A3S9HAE4_9LACT|nr:FliA/WhiG family RNA polymerase sigma factor [Jeotgalibaca ciconiae]AZP04287.1 FliA/WhiG family RNA polymerase sigma factor [Jeotgalibaca ciconiae]
MYSEYEQSREDQILQYLPLVEKVVNGINVKSREYERGDLINFGVIGLMDAIEKYDHLQKVPFESYAYLRIRGAIIDEVRKTSHVSRNGMDKVKKFYRAKEDLQNSLKRDPSEKEIMQSMNLSEKQLDDIYDIIHQLSAVSLEQLIFNEDGNGTTLVEFIEDPHTEQAEDLVLLQEQKAYLVEAVKQLTEREQQILQLYYHDKLPLKEIAYIFDVSVPRISQIHGKAIVKLRDYIGREYRD